MRLQKYLAACGLSSRRGAQELIEQGLVTINGAVVLEKGVQVEDGDEVRVRGEVVRPEATKHVVMYYKPVGEVTTVSDPQGRPTVLDKFQNFPVRLYPVGRLDYDSEGLLLLTNDGDLTMRLTHPRYEVKKSYIARVSNQLGEEALRSLRAGVLLDGRKTAPANVRVLRRDPFSTDILIAIHEGRNRQIRRMVAAVGHEVVRLKRVRYGNLSLGDLQRGEWRELTPEEVASI